MRKIFFVLILFFMPALSYSQLYQGPASGSVPSGVMVNMSTFINDSNGDLISPVFNKPLRPRMEVDLFPDYMNPDPETKSGESTFIEDKSVQQDRGGSDDPLMLKSYQGFLDPGSYIPPDFDIAVGTTHVIGTDNGRFRIWDKSGNLLKTINTDQWFASTLAGASTFDPKIKYDHHSDRWILVLLHQTDSPPESYILISVSDNADPFGAWYNWAIPGDVNGSANSGNWTDYQGVGFDDEALYITSNQFSYGSNFFGGSKIRIINKTQLYANTAGALAWQDLWDIRVPSSPANRSFGVRPSIIYGNPSEFYLLCQSAFNTGTSMYLYKITNALTTPVMTGVSVPVATYSPPPNANQLGGGTPLIDGGSFNIRHEPTYRNGFLWGTHSVSDGAGFSNARYVKINVNTNAADQDFRFGAAGHYHTYPALAVDKDMNIVMTFSRSANDEYMGAYYTSSLDSDPPGTFSGTHTLQPGKANYIKTFGGTRNRWGDYQGAFVDPSDQNNMWILTEYAETPANTWAGWIANIRLIPFSGARMFTSSDSLYFGVHEVGTESGLIDLTLYNFGSDNLSISNIQSSDGQFVVTAPTSFPLNLAFNDSTKVTMKFQPSSAGIKTSNLTITSNDGVTPSRIVKLGGQGYSIAPVVEGDIYGATGTQAGGLLVTLNKTNGTATTVGPTNFSQLNGLSVRTSNNQLFGSIVGSPNSQLVRVNAGGGDAYEYSTVPISNIRGIAFDLNDDLYMATTNGDIYKYDVTNGDTTFIGSSGINNTYGLAINPANGELWSVSLLGTVYKINKSNGSATSVGAVGQGLIGDIAFDVNGNLFGTSGVSSQSSSLVSINTTTGAGTLIGATGILGINGLAISPESTGIQNISGNVPEKYELYQNYPNPFNPVTNIKFDLPKSNSVRLTVFNTIGQEVAVLYSGKLEAGTYEYQWDASTVASGIYFYRIESADFVSTKKLVLLK